MSSFPAKPAVVRQITAESGSSFITVEWDTSANTELPVIGYLVKIDDGMAGDYSVAYDGTNFPNVHKYMVSGLTTALSYRFTVQAINFNGYSEASDPTQFTACASPSLFSVPTMPAVT